MTHITQATRDAAVATYLAGATYAQTAARHGVSMTSVQRWVTKATTRDPRLLSTRHPDCDASPPIYRGGWTVRGGVRRPLINIRAATTPTRPTHLDTGDTAA